MKLFVLIALTALACTRPAAIEITPVAAGEWQVLTSRDDGALLRRIERGGSRTSRASALPQLALLGDTMRTVQTDTFSVVAGKSSITLANVDHGRFFFSLAGPQLIQSPANEELYALEHEHAVWVFKSRERTMNKLTLDDGLDSLLAKQREGEVILYWAANPMWTGDGEFISFLTNRHAVRAGVRGQQMWVVHTMTGIENDLFVAPGVNTHNDGVFEDDIVMSSDRAPGVFIISPRDSSATRISGGYLVAYDKRGRAILVNEDGQLKLLRRGEEEFEMLPALPPGLAWTPTAAISPSGQRVAAYATNDNGRYVVYIYDSRRKDVVSADLPAPPIAHPVWISDRDFVFSAQTPRTEPQLYRVRVR